MAVNNIRTRLNVLYNDAAELTADAEGDVYVTSLKYPYHAHVEFETMREVS
jgi:hypothetical protein